MEKVADQVEIAKYTDELLNKKVHGVYNRYIKRIIDFSLALILTICISPILICVSIAIFIDSGRPVLYRAQRGGYKNCVFRINKFRSMVQNADKIGGCTTALHDSRITRIGRFLRKTKIDELPQIFNILRGEMSFVGPRPEALKYVDMFQGQEKYILQVRPGITDFSSLKYSDMDAIVGDGDVDTYFMKQILPKKNALRIQYIAEISFATDLVIFFKTFFCVFGHFFKKKQVR